MINKFITFEGGEGAGKTTQIKLLAEHLRGQGHEVVTTREPGGTPNAEAIRKLLIENDKLEALSEVLLNFAARQEHVEKVIKPALAGRKWVLCDRFYDSTFVYQGYAQGVELDKIENIRKVILENFIPYKTILLDIDPKISLSRAEARGDVNRFEKKSLAFHQKIRNGFLELAGQGKSRFVIVDANKPIEEIQLEVQRLFISFSDDKIS